MASSSAATAELNDLVLCGRHVALLPYSPRHVPVYVWGAHTLEANTRPWRLGQPLGVHCGRQSVGMAAGHTRDLPCISHSTVCMLFCQTAVCRRLPSRPPPPVRTANNNINSPVRATLTPISCPQHHLHVRRRFKWQCEPGNRLDEELVSATEAEEQERQQALASDENRLSQMPAEMTLPFPNPADTSCRPHTRCVLHGGRCRAPLQRSGQRNRCGGGIEGKEGG